MKKYTPLDGLRWSRNSDSALNNMPQTDVLGRAGGAAKTCPLTDKHRFPMIFLSHIKHKPR